MMRHEKPAILKHGDRPSSEKHRQIRKDDKNALWLYFYFLRIGSITFGSGGMLVIMQIKRDFVERYGWLTEEEMWDMYGVGRSLPGLMVSDVVCIFGYSLYGVAGAIAAILGIATTPVIAIIAVTMFYGFFRENYWVTAILGGVRAVVLPIILTGSLSMIKGAYKHRACYAITVLSFILYITGVSVISVVLVDIACGVLVGHLTESNSS